MQLAVTRSSTLPLPTPHMPLLLSLLLPLLLLLRMPSSSLVAAQTSPPAAAAAITFGEVVRSNGRPVSVSVQVASSASVRDLSLHHFVLTVGGVFAPWNDAYFSQTSANGGAITFRTAVARRGSYVLTFINRRPRFSLCPPDFPLPASVDTAASAATLIGTGTAASCTEAAVRAALTSPGVFRFNCGSKPITITISEEISLPLGGSGLATVSDGSPLIVLDGVDRVTLQGAGTNRLFSLEAPTPDMPGPLFHFQNLKFSNFHYKDPTTKRGGGVYSARGGSAIFLNCEFFGNSAPAPPCTLGPRANCYEANGFTRLSGPGQDIAGGAISVLGGGGLRLHRCRFWNNSASNGGAVGVDDAQGVFISDSWFANNTAAGTLGQPGNGGHGGAVYVNGPGVRQLHVCGTVFATNTANVGGAGLFRSSNFSVYVVPRANVTMRRCLFDRNTASTRSTGALHLEACVADVRGCTFTRNRGVYSAAVHVGRGVDTVTLANSIFSANHGHAGSTIELQFPGNRGSLSRLTVAHNSGEIADGAVRGSPKMYLSRSVIHEACARTNSNLYPAGTCNAPYREGGYNFQHNGACMYGPAKLCSPAVNVSAANVVTPLTENDFCVSPKAGSPAATAKAGATCDSNLYKAAVAVDSSTLLPIPGGSSSAFVW